MTTARQSFLVAGRAFFGLLLLLSLLAFSSCSFIYEYVVINGTTSPVEVEYSELSCCPPATKAVRQLGDSDEPWRPVRADELSFDHAAQTVTVVLQPDEALLVSRLSYPASDIESYKSFPLSSLRIKGARGGVSYEGDQVLPQFEKLNSKVYAATYRSKDGK